MLSILCGDDVKHNAFSNSYRKASQTDKSKLCSLIIKNKKNREYILQKQPLIQICGQLTQPMKIMFVYIKIVQALKC